MNFTLLFSHFCPRFYPVLSCLEGRGGWVFFLAYTLLGDSWSLESRLVPGLVPKGRE